MAINDDDPDRKEKYAKEQVEFITLPENYCNYQGW